MTTLAPSLFGRLGAGVLLLADRCCRWTANWPDGSYLSRIYAAQDQRAKRDPIVVRWWNTPWARTQAATSSQGRTGC